MVRDDVCSPLLERTHRMLRLWVLSSEREPQRMEGHGHAISFPRLVPLAPYLSSLLCPMGFCFKLALNEVELTYDEVACFAFESLGNIVFV